MARRNDRAPRSADDSAAWRASLSVALAVAAYGLSFGALSVAAGLDIWQTSVLSLLMFSGGSQFALVGVIAGGGTAAGPAAVAAAALLGSRNTLYAIRMAPIIGHGWVRRLLAGWLTIDESTAVATAQPTLRSQRIGFWVTGTVIFIGWNLTTLIGAVIGDLVGDVRQYGLDAAAAAAFLGLLWPRLKELQPVVVAIGAAVVATVLTPVLPPGLPIIAAALVAVVVGLGNWFARRIEPDPAAGAPAAGAPTVDSSTPASPTTTSPTATSPAATSPALGSPAEESATDPPTTEEPQ